MNFQTGREHLGGVLDRHYQHKPSVPGQEHDPNSPDQLRGHGYGGTRMLYSDYGSCDLGR